MKKASHPKRANVMDTRIQPGPSKGKYIENFTKKLSTLPISGSIANWFNDDLGFFQNPLIF